LDARYPDVTVSAHCPAVTEPRVTDAEARVLRLAAAGLRADEIAEALDLSRETVAWHLVQACRKLGLRNHAASDTEEERPCTRSR
jgi:DNA-binding CsgD family transcriptional regulator